MSRPDTQPKAGLEDAAEAYALVTRALVRLARGERHAGLEIADALLVMAEVAQSRGLAEAARALDTARDIVALSAEGAQPTARDLAQLTASLGVAAAALSEGCDPGAEALRLADLAHLRDDLARRALLGAADLWLAEARTAPDAQMVGAVQALTRLIDAWAARTGRHLRLVLDTHNFRRDGEAVGRAVAALGKLADLVCQRTDQPQLTFQLSLRSHVLGSAIELAYDGPGLEATAPCLADSLLDAMANDIGAPAPLLRPREPALAVIEAEIGGLGGTLSMGRDAGQTMIRVVLPRSAAATALQRDWEAQAA